MRKVLRFVVPMAVVLAALCVSAQNNKEEHLADAAAALYQQSAFAHGYIHGYEQGFHLADLDIQMGHLLPGVHVRREQRDVDPHYRPADGDKSLFTEGFKFGMRAGYADSLAGVPFRGVAEMRNAAAGLTAGTPSPRFDRGVYDGFIAGERQGSADHHASAALGSVSACLQQHAVEKRSDSPQYCDGYARGFQLGYDETAERRGSQRSIETAEKR